MNDSGKHIFPGKAFPRRQGEGNYSQSEENAIRVFIAFALLAGTYLWVRGPSMTALSVSNWDKSANRTHFVLLMMERIQA
jgi:hypothetical protein